MVWSARTDSHTCLTKVITISACNLDTFGVYMYCGAAAIQASDVYTHTHPNTSIPS
jgi:hypothetical protein